MRSNRRGMGVTTLIIASVLVFLILGSLTAKLVTRSTTRTTQALVAGDEATLAAISALEEGWALIEQTVNETDSPLRQMFIAPLQVNDDSCFEATLAPVISRSLFSSNPTISISDITLEVPNQEWIWCRNELEKMGKIKLTVSVNVFKKCLRRRVERRITQRREFKVIYAAPPRPFDRTSLFVTVPHYLEGYEKQYRELQERVDSILQQAEDRSESVCGQRIDIPRPFVNNTCVYRYFPNYNYPPFPYNERAPQATDYSERILLENTDIDNFLLSLEPELTGKDFKLLWPTDITNNSEALKTFECELKSRLADYVKKFPYVREEGLRDFLDAYLNPLMSIDLEGSISVTEAIEFYKKNRATHIFEDQKEMWAEIGKNDVFLDGIYYVDGPVDVDMCYRGRGSIVSRNRLTVHRCTKKEPSAICTLMSFSDSSSVTGWSSIELKNDVEAGLVAVTGMVKNLHLYNVKGSLAVGALSKEVIDGLGGAEGTSHDWRLSYDENLWYASLDGKDLRTEKASVVVGPHLPSTSIVR